MPVTIKVLGLEELEQKCQTSILLDPAIEEGINTIKDRMLRQGKGLGAKRNVLAATSTGGSGLAFPGAEIRTSLVWPRTTGSSLKRKDEAIFKAMSGNVIRKAIQRIRDRWGA